MELSELTAYALEKYHIEEEHKWADFPGFSVLCHPLTGKWAALLMQQWDSQTGSMIQRCDLRCGADALREFPRPYLTAPIRMRGSNWIGISFEEDTEKEIVCRLFDRAIGPTEPSQGFTVMLEDAPAAGEKKYQETMLPFTGRPYQPRKPEIPDKLRQMRRMYEYGPETLEEKARHFYEQGKFMEDFEDDVGWEGDYVCYFPVYQDLTLRQLRGYFSWRTHVRRGDFQRIAAPAAYIYIFELLNGIGTSSHEDALQKLLEFEEGYLDSMDRSGRMRQNIRRWMKDYAIVHDMPVQAVMQFEDPDLMARDERLAVLRDPQLFSDEALWSAVLFFTGSKIEASPVLSLDKGKHLICQAWRTAVDNYKEQGKNLFTLCFGQQAVRSWKPLSNVVYCWRDKPADFEYKLNACRTYRCVSGEWRMEAYEKPAFEKSRFNGFFHQADLMLRRYLKTGRYLKEKPEDAWAAPLLSQVIEADRQAEIEASRPKITIDLSGLEQIRQDADVTRDRLLYVPDEGPIPSEIRHVVLTPSGSHAVAEGEPVPAISSASASSDGSDNPGGEPEPVVSSVSDASNDGDGSADLPLDPLQIRILHALLRGDSVNEMLKENHLFPNLVADAVNEAMFDLIGDTVLSCEDDTLAVMEDYREDLENLLGGATI